MTLGSQPRDRSLTRRIYEAYRLELQDGLIGIVMCGGAGKPDVQEYRSADIDYIVIVTDIDVRNLVGLSKAQRRLGQESGPRPSHTVITYDEFRNAPHAYNAMDGKAVQALIEAKAQDIAGITMSQLPKFSTETIRDYSWTNALILRALLRKIIVRSEADPSDPDKVLMAKIALIIQKMQKQSEGPLDPSVSWMGRDILQDIKLNPGSYGSETVRRLMLRFIAGQTSNARIFSSGSPVRK